MGKEVRERGEERKESKEECREKGTNIERKENFMALRP
jgi:hypothetical protein